LGVSKETITIHHIGGLGGYGHTERLAPLRDIHWVVYDAREAALATSKDPGASYEFINKPVWSHISKVELKVTAQESASSLLEPAPGASLYTFFFDDGRKIEWGKHASVKERRQLETTSLDELVSGGAPAPDFLSIDAQGAELEILRGGSNTIRKDTLGIILETEFEALYQGQGLFPQISEFLAGKAFRLCETYNLTYVNVQPLPFKLTGKGHLTLCESLFLRRHDSVEETGQKLKLAAIAVALDQLDYAMAICDELGEGALNDAKNTFYGKMLNDVYVQFRTIKDHTPMPTDWVDGTPGKRVGAGGRQVLLAWFSLVLVSKLSAKKLAKRYSSPVARTLYKYGLKDVADMQEMRAFMQGYRDKGIDSGYLDLVSDLGFRHVR